MSTDLKQKERTAATRQPAATVTTSRGTWPYALAAIVLAVVVAVGMLVLTQSEPVATYQDPNTEIREGSGYAKVEQTGTFPDLNTAAREGSGYAQVEQTGTFPDLNTAAREGSGYAKVEGGAFPDLNTEIREGSGYAKAPEPGTLEAWQG